MYMAYTPLFPNSSLVSLVYPSASYPHSPHCPSCPHRLIASSPITYNLITPPARSASVLL